jgi:hypothetical protein
MITEEKAIRSVMARTGWTRCETVRNMWRAMQSGELPFYEILDDGAVRRVEPKRSDKLNGKERNMYIDAPQLGGLYFGRARCFQRSEC